MKIKDIDIESEIMEELLREISEDKYKENDKLPSDNELAEKYSVPRIKIRHVYEKLQKMGYVYSLQGRGRFAKKRTQNIELILSGNESFSKKLKEKGYDLVSRNIFFEKIYYSKRIYDELKSDKDDEIYKIGRLRIVNGEPIAIHISYVSKRVFPNINKDGNVITSMFEYYKSNGFNNYSTEKSILEVGYATLQERIYLECEELVPVLKLETNCNDKDTGKVLEYTEIIYRSDRFKYKIF